MLSQMNVVTSSGNTIVFPIFGATDGYVVSDIKGLEPVKASYSVTNFAGTDGVFIASGRQEGRNVVFDVKLFDTGKASIASMRERLYQYVMPNTPVRLEFVETTGRISYTAGWVESVETELFTQTPTVSVSVLCMDPALYLKDGTVIDGMTTETVVETPFYYNGSMPTGFIFKMTVPRVVHDLDLAITGPDQVKRDIDFGYEMETGDELTIIGVSGSRAVRILRNGSEINALSGIIATSAWPLIKPGQNFVRVLMKGAPVPYTLSYMTRIGGL